MRIAFLTADDPLDRRSWSGILYYMFRALQNAGGEVAALGPKTMKLASLLIPCSMVAQKLTGKSYVWTHNPLLSRQYGRFFSQALQSSNYDIVFAPAASMEVACLETSLPVVYLSDTTFFAMIDYYDYFSNLLNISKRHGCWIEQRALSKASVSVFPSRWAQQSAVADFGVPIEKTRVIPFGANIDHPPQRQAILSKQTSDTCRLLFLGVDWKRKGGDIAYHAFLKLREKGIKATLTVCGCSAPHLPASEEIILTGTLNKNNPADAEKLNTLLLESDFLLLPTRAECFGVVFSEASAYGLPSIATDTGGVRDSVTDGVNGRLLALSAGPDEYAEAIAELWRSRDAYRALATSARLEYEKRLNWEVWGTEMISLMQQLKRK